MAESTAKATKNKPMTSYEVSVFCRQMSLLLSAGIGPLESVDIMSRDTADAYGKKVLDDIMETLLTGEKFHIALKMSEVFPEYVVNMVRIGEESGSIDVVMDSLADYYDREEDIKESIKSAVSYPMIMILLMLVVIIVLIVRVLPIFSQVFAQLGTGMNSFSQTLLNFGNALNRYSFVLVILLAVICGLFLYFTRTESGKKRFMDLTKGFGPIRRIYDELATERFASGMVLTLSSGMDTFESLNLVRSLVENENMSEKITECQNYISPVSDDAEGLSFPEAIEKAGIFNRFYSRMIAIGFRSGSMDTVMKQIAAKYAEKTQRRIYSFISVLEPTLVIILSLIVGLILMSVILPLMGIMSSIG